MPIYAYRCESCGFSKDVLQKMSDPVLTDCPSCGESSFKRQVTAAGFQLKGNGWYVTDFRNGSSNQSSSASNATASASVAKDAADHSASASVDAAPTAKSSNLSDTPSSVGSKADN